MPGRDLIIAPAQASRPAAAGVEASGLAARAAAYAEASLASSTRRAYDSSWRTFASWCGGQHVCALPATPETLAAFLTDIAPGAKVATLSRHIAGIRRAHQAAGFQFPDHPKLDKIWGGIRREHGAAPNQKRALVTADLRRVIGRLPIGVAGVRDKALLLLGFAAALRRSELAALELGDTAVNRCNFVAGGLEIRLGRSKTDQESHGQVVAVPHGKTKLLPGRRASRLARIRRDPSRVNFPGYYPPRIRGSSYPDRSGRRRHRQAGGRARRPRSGGLFPATRCAPGLSPLRRSTTSRRS